MAVPELIVFWKCSDNTVWDGLRFRDRLEQFRSAVRMAGLVRLNAMPGNGVWMFLGPEYAFGRRNHGRPQAAEQVTPAKEQSLLQEMAVMTQADHSLLLIPGTIVVRDTPGNQGRARNTSHAYFDGLPVWRFGKIRNLGEVDPNDQTTAFMPGTGWGMTDIHQTTYGGEICADATGQGTLPEQVDVHVIQGQSVNHNDVKNKARQLQVVGDYALPQVWDYRGRFLAQIQPSHQTRCRNAELIYFQT